MTQVNQMERALQEVELEKLIQFQSEIEKMIGKFLHEVFDEI